MAHCPSVRDQVDVEGVHQPVGHQPAESLLEGGRLFAGDTQYGWKANLADHLGQRSTLKADVLSLWES
jgi:hypothetical protein